MARSQNGWTALARVFISTYTVPGTNVKLPLRRGDAATVLLYVAARFHWEVEALVAGGCWGYAARLVRGSSTVVSNHASGTAIDLNAPAHPRGKHGTYTAKQLGAIRAILNDPALGGTVRCGEFFKTTVDGMHFELVGSPAEVAAAAKRIKAARKVKTWKGLTWRAVAAVAGVPLGVVLVLNPGASVDAPITPGTVVNVPSNADPVAPPKVAPTPIDPANVTRPRGPFPLPVGSVFSVDHGKRASRYDGTEPGARTGAARVERCVHRPVNGYLSVADGKAIAAWEKKARAQGWNLVRVDGAVDEYAWLVMSSRCPT